MYEGHSTFCWTDPPAEDEYPRYSDFQNYAQYLDYLHKLEELDVDVVFGFIYMAATLIYIKSKMLLPPDPFGGAERAEKKWRSASGMVQRLVEHEKFKNRRSFCI